MFHSPAEVSLGIDMAVPILTMDSCQHWQVSWIGVTWACQTTAFRCCNHWTPSE
jgi:hypothetical protein